MEDVSKVKPYIKNLNNQLDLLEADLQKFSSKSLNEQLLLLTDEREKLELSNKYAYTLSSLLFAYMKVLDVKDLGPVMTELDRVKQYMNTAKKLDARKADQDTRKEKQQEDARTTMSRALQGRRNEPAISRVNFQGKHTRFEADGEGSKGV
ncbi:LAMI_0C04280g1_1 [Lachancea mirantina]|uniref:Exosome complex protein n=1 Tax=Lachancea mirantina TaxID=1230905 RepID=A0A1G4J265_9SACH|nr:LAMI_0C04280g1_1 [Lachancea mirantina]